MTDRSVGATIRIRAATPDDVALVTALLTQNSQSAHGVLAPGSRYWLAENANGDPIGAVGLEFGSPALTEHALEIAVQLGCAVVYLFSTGAGDFWSGLGFRQVPVPELVAALPNTPQVRHYEALGSLEEEVAWRRDVVA
jgi:N-acetylglutamate synthase-like GNAT family acetyltransferase